MSINCYEHDFDSERGVSFMVEISGGRWVEYEDHLEIVKQLQDKIDDLESDLTYARNN